MAQNSLAASLVCSQLFLARPGLEPKEEEKIMYKPAMGNITVPVQVPQVGIGRFHHFDLARQFYHIVRQRGIKFVYDCGSSHIHYQDGFLREEFAQWGDRLRGVDPRAMEKEDAKFETGDMITVPLWGGRRAGCALP
jgi:hypothetical protein